MSSNYFFDDFKQWLFELEIPFEFEQIAANQLKILFPQYNQTIVLIGFYNFQIPEIDNNECIFLYEDYWFLKKEIVQNRLKSKWQLSERVFARKCQIKRIQKKECEHFLNQHHLFGYASAYYKFALIKENEIEAVMCFSKGRKMNDAELPYFSFELIRFASKSGTTVIGGFSKLLQHFIKELKPDHIMTYIDKNWSDANNYQKFGFKSKSEIYTFRTWINLQNMERLGQKTIEQIEDNKDIIEISPLHNFKLTLDLRKIGKNL